VETKVELPAKSRALLDVGVANALEQIVTLLFRNRFQLESLFRYFDANGDGTCCCRP